MPMPNIGDKLKEGKLSVNGEPARADVRVVKNADRTVLGQLVELAERAKAAQAGSA